MKKKNLDKMLEAYGWWFLRQGGNHEVWTNGEHIVMVPRHREINELTAKSIIIKAKKNSLGKQ